VKQLPGHFRSARPALPLPSVAWIGAVLLGLAVSLRADELPAPVTFDVPIPVNRALPAWIGQPDSPATNFAMLDLPILTPDTTASLLVTVYFQEKPGGFLRIIWKGTQGAEVLSDNFYEDIGMANQRSLLISPSSLVGDGTLTFQTSDSTLGIQRIKLEWLENKNGLVSPEIQDMLVTSSSGLTQPSLTLSGQPTATTPGLWQDQLVTVPMTDAPVRIEQGVDFSVDLDQVPGAARIALEETGLPLGKRLVVWINDQRAGTITPAVPDLTDSGYLKTTGALTNQSPSTSYVGWRDASFIAPVSLLKAGVNTVQFSTEDDSSPTASSPATPTPSADAPLAIKSLVMQLDYTPTDAAPTAAAATPDALPQFLSPTGPILRTDSDATSSATPTP
jgi:hypothetical protein